MSATDTTTIEPVQPPPALPKRRPWIVRHGAAIMAASALVLSFAAIAQGSAPGPAGPQGPQGVTGQQGPAGDQGPAGARGPAGKSITVTSGSSGGGSQSGAGSSTAAATIPGDGTFIVGTDIQPGTYRSTPADPIGGYWERLSGLSGVMDDIIANDIVTTGAAVVTITPSDKAFKSQRMNTWHKVS